MKDAQEEEEGREEGAGLSGLAGARPFDMGAALARSKKRGVPCHCHVNAQTRQRKRGVRRHYRKETWMARCCHAHAVLHTLGCS